MSALPKWVWDLIADLEDEEDVHPTLYREGLGVDVYARYDWCPAKALERVPAEVRAAARVLATYRRPNPEPIKAPGCTCPDLDASMPTEPFATVKGLDRNCPRHGGAA